MIPQYFFKTRDIVKRHSGLAGCVVLSFFFGILWGFIAPSSIKRTILHAVLTKFESMVSENAFQNFLNIFFNNALVGLFLILGGFTIFIVFIMIIINGFIIGIIIDLFMRIGGPTFTVISTLLLKIAPHGILEIPAILLCALLGARLGLGMIFKKFRTPFTKRFGLLKETALIYGMVALPLFVGAAAIEAFITPAIPSGNLETMMRPHDAVLLPVLLNASDVAPFGFTPYSIAPLDLASQRASNKMSYRYALTIVYNETLLAWYRDIAKNPSADVAYVLNSTNTTLHLHIIKLSNLSQAQSALNFSQKALTILARESTVTIVPAAHFTILNDETKVYYLYMATEGRYFYSLQMESPNDTKIFLRLIQLQKNKIKIEKNQIA